MEKYSYNDAVRQADGHKIVHHYTTFDALEKIISNKSLRLTRIDLLNDTVENAKIAEPWKKKIFVCCFTHRKYESYFFWKSYAKGSPSGVMLSFESQYLRSLTIYPDDKCNNTQLDDCHKTESGAQYSPAISAEAWGIFDNKYIDVMYVPRNEKLEYDENFQGRLKYVEWDSEEETRIRVAIRPKCLEIKHKDGGIQYLTPDNEYLYAKLPDACLESMTITLSPFAGNDLKEKVETLLKKSKLTGKVQVRTSVLTTESR